jgi:hypothetical protein
MGQVTLSPEADAATWSSGIAAGVGNHLPVGEYGSANYRSGIRFPIPSGWAGWTAVTKATLNIWTSDFDHVGPRNSSIYVRRQTTAGLWTKAEGSQSCESGFSAGNSTQYSDLTGVTTGQVSFSSGSSANTKRSVVVTGLVEYYRAQGASKIALILDNVGSSDYSEFWSRHKSGYDITLVLEYEDDTVPDIPTLGAPVAGAVSITQTPTFSWTHNDPQGDPQTEAQVRVWQGSSMVQQGATQTVAGSANYIGWPVALPRDAVYQWDVRTRDALGYSEWSGRRQFSVKALPVVTVTNERFMEYASGAPRLRVKWTVAGGTQKRYKVTAGAYDSGWVTSTLFTHLLTGLALTNGTAVSVTVTVETTDVLQGSASRSFTPRWGVTTHRHEFTAVPTGWGTPSLSQTVPTGASIYMEYGSGAVGAGGPTAWYSSLSSVPKNRTVFWRATFIPSATAGPTLDRIIIPASFASESVDHWFGALLAGGIPNGLLASGWGIDVGEYVYGTRSITKEGNGVLNFAYSKRIPVRAGHTYILSGFMRSVGNPGARFSLTDADTNTVLTTPDPITGLDVLMQSDLMSVDREWHDPASRAPYRYATPYWMAPADMDVIVRLHSGGPSGSQVWWDGLQLEESTVVTPWSAGLVGAVSVDSGAVQVDAFKGAAFRLRGSLGGARDVVEIGSRGLAFGGSSRVNLWSPAAGVLEHDGEYRTALLAVDGVITPPAMTADQNNYAPTGHDTAFHFRLSSDATVRTISGLVGPSHTQGTLIILSNNNTGTAINILNDSSLSTGVNRFFTPGAVTYVLGPRMSAMAIYDLVYTRWRILS